MQKDVIYIDVEDDITAIIGKVKAAERHIVALVPPKRVGAIQSAVNLKLVHRAAEHADKRLVIITSNAALMALAGSAGIPVAKTLQSKPTLAEIPALDIDDGDDVIDGSDAPGAVATDTPEAAAVEAVAAEEASDSAAPKRTTVTKTATLGAAALAAKDKVKVPNFDTFRKKLFIGIAAFFLLIGLLVWALLFAPKAQVVITARTTDAALNSKVSLAPTATTDLKAGTIKAEIKTTKKDVAIPFTATGKKDVGEKATGTVKFSKLTQIDTTVPAGTQVTHTSSGLVYVTTAAATIPASQPCFPTYCAQSVSVAIAAAENGTKYNGASGAATAPGVTATITNATTGGTDKTVTVVQQSDVDQVSDSVLKSGEADAAKADLKKQFGDGFVILDSTFISDSSAVKPAPAVGAESSDGKASLAGSVVFTIVAVPKPEASKYLDSYFAQQIDGKANQKVYANGLGQVSFTDVSGKDGTYNANISTNGKIGPKIDETALKEFTKGKRLGEIQSHIQAISGVDNVDVRFSPFWVTSAPNDVKRITIEFKVNGA